MSKKRPFPRKDPEGKFQEAPSPAEFLRNADPKMIKLLGEYRRRLWTHVTYDLLDLVPPMVMKDEEEEEEETHPEEEESEEETTTKIIPKIEPIVVGGLGRHKERPTPSSPEISIRDPSRRMAINPAPNSKDFSPDWYDVHSGVEFALATGPLVEDHRKRHPRDILFWTRCRGNNTKGEPKQVPMIFERVDLIDLHTGQHVATGRIAERFITARRVMGYVSITSLYWDKEAPIYFDPKGVAIAFAMFTFWSFLVINCFYYMERYDVWYDVYQKKLFYNQQPICQDSGVKARLEKENNCDANAVFLKTPIWRRALMDVLEGAYICSDGTCRQWFNQVILLVTLVGVLISYLFIRHTAWAFAKAEELKTHLPLLFGPTTKRKKAE